jgi:hypothetical protein
VVYLAEPWEIVTVPSVEVPSIKVTDPVATHGVTIALKITLWPETDGFCEALRTMVVGALFTVWVMPDDVLVAKLEFPL